MIPITRSSSSLPLRIFISLCMETSCNLVAPGQRALTFGCACHPAQGLRAVHGSAAAAPRGTGARSGAVATKIGAKNIKKMGKKKAATTQQSLVRSAHDSAPACSSLNPPAHLLCCYAPRGRGCSDHLHCHLPLRAMFTSFACAHPLLTFLERLLSIASSHS